jgi:hypothetical protein
MPHTVARHTHGEFSFNCREVGVAGKNDERDDQPRHFLKCMAWAGTGAVWTMSSGILKGSPLGQSAGKGMMTHGGGEHRRHRNTARGDREDQAGSSDDRPRGGGMKESPRAS